MSNYDKLLQETTEVIVSHFGWHRQVTGKDLRDESEKQTIHFQASNLKNAVTCHHLSTVNLQLSVECSL